MQDRVPTHKRITDGGAEGIVKIGVDDIGPTTTYCLPLSDEAFSEVSDFAFRALLEKQYENWENALQAGAERSSIGDEDIIASHGFQEIYQALNALMECTSVSISGLKVIYDTAISEIITVAAAIARGYTDTYTTTAVDTDIFLVVHVLPDSALLDATYGVDIAHDTDFHGALKVFGGKVVRDAPALDLQPGYNGTIIPVTNIAHSDTLGSWNSASFALPVLPGSSNPPCNDCLTFIDVPIPPPFIPPPVPPTGGGVPTLPTAPSPNQPINADIACSTIFEDVGWDLTAFYELISVSFKAYGNSPIVSTYPASLSGAIHTWITTNVPDFDFTCDKLLNIKLKLLVTLTDNGIFGFIPNPFPSNTKTPTILSIESTSPRIYQDIFYFPIDKKQTEDIVSGVPFPTYQENFYEDTHTIAIRDKDRADGSVGFEKWAFGVDAGDYITSVSVTPLQLQMCGISYKKHQYLAWFKFDGSDEFRIIGGVTYVYDFYGNARIELPGGTFITDGLDLEEDGVHGSTLKIDWICDLSTDKTSANMTVEITDVTGALDTNTWSHVSTGGGVVGGAGSALTFTPKTSNHTQYGYTVSTTFVHGQTYETDFLFDNFCDLHYKLYNLVAWFD